MFGRSGKGKGGSPAAVPGIVKPTRQRITAQDSISSKQVANGADALQAAPGTPPASGSSTPSTSRAERLARVLEAETVDIGELRKIGWSGIPHEHRALAWRLLLGYLPANRERRAATLERKRREYRDAVARYFDVNDDMRSDEEMHMKRQIAVDVPRTCPDVPLFHQSAMQQALERVLYVWSIRHPASGYVQGINDLITPFMFVFLDERVTGDVLAIDTSTLSADFISDVEADTFWCTTALLQGIQDNYTFAQPGIQRNVFKLKEIVHRIDAELYGHLEEQGLEFIQFAFRWMNCLLMRELRLELVVRLWDTYIAEGANMRVLHVYTCAALLSRFSRRLQSLEFQDLVMMLQHLPTQDWGERELSELLSQAFVWMSMFENAQNHLQL